MHPFDSAIALQPMGDHAFRGRTSSAYANMVGPFGGITAATLLHAPMQHPARLGDPIALTVNFAAGVADGEFDVLARPARTNRSTQHWIVELVQNGEVAATATAVFATRRPTWSAPEAVAPTVPRASEVAPMQRGKLPWTERFDMRFVKGPLHFDDVAQADSISQVWTRDEPPRALDFASLASISDSFFPRVYVRRGKASPIGTVSITTYFHADRVLLAAQGDRAVLGVARALCFRNGYFDQSGEVWSDDGTLLASTSQMVYFRE